MAKRFIDTEIFSDEWFHDLSKDCKLFFIYYITNCDWAGVLKLNKKLCVFQTKIESPETLIQELGDSLVRVPGESTYFMPRFITFQYPGFPKSSVAQQKAAIKSLKSHGFWDENKNYFKTVWGESPDSPVNVTVDVNVNDIASVNEVIGNKVNNVTKLTHEENLVLNDKTGDDLPF